MYRTPAPIRYFAAALLFVSFALLAILPAFVGMLAIQSGTAAPMCLPLFMGAALCVAFGGFSAYDVATGR